MAKEKMIRRVVVQSVTVVRDGQRVTPERGKAFDFTPEEIEYLDRISPAASRKPLNESPAPAPVNVADDDEDEDDDAEPDAEAPAKPAAPAKAKPAAKKPAAPAKPASSEDDDI